MFSSSSSFPPSEGFATPTSFEREKLAENENNRTNNENQDGNHERSEQSSGKREKFKSKDAKIAKDGNYQCQFCEKSFPRLGYLKKHEQVKQINSVQAFQEYSTTFTQNHWPILKISENHHNCLHFLRRSSTSA